MGPSINDITHLGEGGSAKKWHNSLSLSSMMGGKGQRGVKNLKIWVTSFMDDPYLARPSISTSISASNNSLKIRVFTKGLML